MPGNPLEIQQSLISRCDVLRETLWNTYRARTELCFGFDLYDTCKLLDQVSTALSASREAPAPQLAALTEQPAEPQGVQAEPVAWTLKETLQKRETTTRGYLWFTDPQNSSWAPLYAAPAAPAQEPQQPAQRDDTDRLLLRELFVVCEATEDECRGSLDNFKRGRVFEAKRISRAVGTWYQDTFCGRSFMGEPVLAAPSPAPAVQPTEAVAELVEALARLLRNFPTDDDMDKAGWHRADVDRACNAYDHAKRVAAKHGQPQGGQG